MTEPVFPSVYIGPIAWWKEAIRFEKLWVEQQVFFQKQSYHNRCKIASANGVLPLSIPTLGSNYQQPLSTMRISYNHHWQKIHWNALESAYGSAPFFRYYDYLLQPLYEHPTESLVEFNFRLLQQIIRFLKVPIQAQLTTTYFADIEPALDFRNKFNAKKEMETEWKSYTQVFDQKLGFLPNLAILDLLFNQGPEKTVAYLKG